MMLGAALGLLGGSFGLLALWREPILVVALFVATALAEIAGCYLLYLWLREGRSAWLLVPAAGALALFVWLLTLHPMAAARTYAAYGGVYVSVAVMMSLLVEPEVPQRISEAHGAPASQLFVRGTCGLPVQLRRPRAPSSTRHCPQHCTEPRLARRPDTRK